MKKITLYMDQKDCCGCSACKSICPREAIAMEKDEFGFFYPRIDDSKCIECGLCTQVCAFEDKDDRSPAPLEAYAAVSKDADLLRRSTSGGIFATLAMHILKNNGVVFGCAYDSEWSAKHIEISVVEDLHKLQGSKYVQSAVGDTFVHVKRYLNEGRTVLYSGTPCQISALRKYLKRDYDHFFCVDLVCHGVGAPKLFEEELRRLCGGQSIQFVDFRSKESGWGTTGVVYTDKKKIKFDAVRSAYYYYFLENSIYRDSCYNCRYASERRVGDLTLGDYWRIESAHPNIEKEIDLKRGISCVLANTPKGVQLLQEIDTELTLIPSQYESIRERNGQLVDCCKEPVIRKEIFAIYQNNGYDAVVRNWKKSTRRNRAVLRVKGIVPSKFKTVLKKFI